jgi:hypothetical protein
VHDHLLALAAREAAIVGIDLRSTIDGRIELASLTAEAVAEQIEWVREAAGARFGDLELHMLVHSVLVTDDRQRGAQRLADEWARLPESMVSNQRAAP